MVDQVYVPGEVTEEPQELLKKPGPDIKPFKRRIVWFNALGFLFLHLASAYSLYYGLRYGKILTFVWTVFLMYVAAQGVLIGAHRLYSHKAFKAKPLLRLALVLFQTMAGQNCLWVWVRDHRQHHKYSDTDADPHNARNGFFFSHIGWLMSRKHPDVISKGKLIDMSDLEADPFVMFQKRYYKILYVLLAMTFPTVIPVLVWGEDPLTAFLVAFLLRTVLSLNMTWSVNSAAHLYGTRPYSKDILPVESALVSLMSLGEGWHNYHHSFPWDYRAAELGQKYNFTTTLLDKFADWGWVYDLRAATPAMVQHRVLKRGDGSHPMVALDTKEQPSPKIVREVSRSPGM